MHFVTASTLPSCSVISRFDSDIRTLATNWSSRWRNHTLYRSRLRNHEIAIVRSLSTRFTDGFEGTANISVVIESISTVWDMVDIMFSTILAIPFDCFFSGHGLSGVGLLVMNSFAAVVAMFGGAMATYSAMKQGILNV